MDIYERIKMLSLEEKAALLQGATTWTTREIKHANIPSIFLADGPHGMRKQAGASDHLGLNASIPATCFPTAATVANSWSTEIGEELGRALGEEAAAHDVHVVLGPGLNIKRNPLCGRNFEYFSEDPYLSGKMAAAYVRGIQANGVAACPKHFAVNSQELRRMAMNSVIDERTLREIYLTAFEMAVKEGGAKTIMSAYNMVNDVYANENSHLLTKILRNEWGFDGFVVTDWGADNDHIDGLKAGSNLVMPAPGADCAINLINAVKEGKIDESVLDQRIAELIKVIDSTTDAVAKAKKSFDRDEHHNIARKCAEESIVLLENDGILPLSGKEKIAIIGDFATTPRYQGAGSSLVNPTALDTLSSCAEEEKMNIIGFSAGYSRTDTKSNDDMLRDAVKLAKNAEVVLLCVGLEEILESEGMDRLHMELSESQKALIKSITDANNNVVLVLSGGAPFVMPERDTYKAAIHGYLGGQAGARAMVKAILGKINPSGKLNESWSISLESVSSAPYFPSRERNSEYREGLYVGYRYFDTANIPVRYPFGYGLSYTTFKYSDLAIDESGVEFNITNTGDRAGAEISQLYIGLKGSGVYRPKKELRGFAKTYLEPGESKRVRITFDEYTFRYFDVKSDSWQIEEGDYDVIIAESSVSEKLSGRIHKNGAIASDDAPECYRTASISNVSDEEYKNLLGRDIPDGRWNGEIGKNDVICQLYYAKSRVARFVYKLLTSMKNKAEAKGKPDLNILFIYNMPFRAISKMTLGMVSDRMVNNILTMVNGHFFKGLFALIYNFIKNLISTAKFNKILKKQMNTKGN